MRGGTHPAGMYSCFKISTAKDTHNTIVVYKCVKLTRLSCHSPIPILGWIFLRTPRLFIYFFDFEFCGTNW